MLENFELVEDAEKLAKTAGVAPSAEAEQMQLKIQELEAQLQSQAEQHLLQHQLESYGESAKTPVHVVARNVVGEKWERER